MPSANPRQLFLNSPNLTFQLLFCKGKVNTTTVITMTLLSQNLFFSHMSFKEHEKKLELTFVLLSRSRNMIG